MSLLSERHQKLRSVFDTVAPHNIVYWPSPLVVDIDVLGHMWQLRDIAQEYFENSKSYEYVNVTPNGMIMPKVENVEMYTAFAREFFRIIKYDLGIWDHFQAWNVPTLRFKESNPNVDNLARPRASENIHSDEWLGWDSSAVVFMIPLAGDVENNGVRFFEHPLDHEWIKHQSSFTTQAAINMVRQSRVLDCGYEIGHLYPNDISVLHQTYRNKGCGWRVSAEIVGYVGVPKSSSFGCRTAFLEPLARGLLEGDRKFKANLHVYEIGDYTESGRALDVEIV